MSVPVSIDELQEHAEAMGARALLITTGDDGRPHVTSVIAQIASNQLTVGGGRKTRSNAAARPHVTLVWPGAPDGSYCLIVDGVAENAAAETIDIRPVAAVLHRLANADTTLASCIRLD